MSELNIEAALARIEGKIDVSNLQHETTNSRVTILETRAHTHSNRLGILEAAGHLAAGERAGIEKTAKVAYALAGILGGSGIAGIIAFIARSQGV